MHLRSSIRNVWQGEFSEWEIVLSLIEKAEEVVDEENAERMLRKMRKNEFSLQDFRDQLRQLKRLGPLDKLLGMLPKMGPMKQLDQLRVDEKQLLHLEAIISSMTPKERANYRNYQRFAAQTDLPWMRSAGLGGQSPVETVHADSQDDETHE